MKLLKLTKASLLLVIAFAPLGLAAQGFEKKRDEIDSRPPDILDVVVEESYSTGRPVSFTASLSDDSRVCTKNCGFVGCSETSEILLSVDSNLMWARAVVEKLDEPGWYRITFTRPFIVNESYKLIRIGVEDEWGNQQKAHLPPALRKNLTIN